MTWAAPVERRVLEEGITLLRLNRPQRMNALGRELLDALHQNLDQLAADRECRAVILAGAGKAFCAGADLKEEAPAPDCETLSPLGQAYKTQERLAGLILKAHELPQPVIAAVNGAAVGGGFALALASDLRVAEKSARFGAVFIRLGLSACDVGVSYLLPRMVGVSRAAELMFTGRIFSAEEAQSIGLLHRLVEDGEGVNAALGLARQVLEHSEYGVWMTKKALRANLDAPSLRHAMEIENSAQTLGYFSGNMEEAVAAFREKRAPRWKGL